LVPDCQGGRSIQMRNNMLLRGFSVGLVILVAAACQGIDEGEKSVAKMDGANIQTALEALPNARVLDVDKVGVPRFVAGQLAELSAAAVSDNNLNTALSAIAPVFRADERELVLERTQIDNIGDVHYRFSQVKDGLRVIGGQIVLHARDGVVYGANGSARSDLD